MRSDPIDALLDDMALDPDQLRMIAQEQNLSDEGAVEFALQAGIRYLRKTGRSEEEVQLALEKARPNVIRAGASDYLLGRIHERMAMLNVDSASFIRKSFEQAFKGADVQPGPDVLDSYVEFLNQDNGGMFADLVQKGFMPDRIATALSDYLSDRNWAGKKMERMEDPDPLIMQEIRRISTESSGYSVRKSVVRLFRLAWLLGSRSMRDDVEVETTILGFCMIWSRMKRAGQLHAVASSILKEIIRNPDFLTFLAEGGRWVACTMPVIRVDARVAAALVFTDLPSDFVDSSVRLPWDCFKIVPLEGVLGGDNPVRDISIFQQRTSRGDRLRMTIFFETGEASLSREVPSLSRLVSWAENEREENLVSAGLTPNDIRTMSLCGKLVVGTCLRMSDPNAVRRRSAKSVKASGFLGSSRSSVGPQTSEFILGGDVKVDLREALREYSRGKAGFRYKKVQWLVHGHWRNQAHGPGRSERKTIWIEPYFKGPEKATVIVRDHVIRG